MLRDANGGSMRVKGAETRRFFGRPRVLRLGERPAGAVKGARGDEMLARAGVERRVGGGGIDVELLGAREKVKGLNACLSIPSFLLFLEGEKRVAGSTFSESVSSNEAGSKGRLVGEERVLVKEAWGLALREVLGLPLRLDFCARIPDFMSNVTSEVKLQSPYHSGGSSHSQDAADAGCREEQRALLPLGRGLPCRPLRVRT